MEPTSRKEEEKFEKNLIAFLRSTGRMFPVTPAQVEAFESKSIRKVKVPDLLADPIAMLERGYINLRSDAPVTENESTHSPRMAARKGTKLSADTLRKMKEHREKAENQE
jgi:hypothetical protein